MNTNKSEVNICWNKVLFFFFPFILKRLFHNYGNIATTSIIFGVDLVLCNCNYYGVLLFRWFKFSIMSIFPEDLPEIARSDALPHRFFTCIRCEMMYGLNVVLRDAVIVWFDSFWMCVCVLFSATSWSKFLQQKHCLCSLTPLFLFIKNIYKLNFQWFCLSF